MATFTYDHMHLRSPDPEATAAWYQRMLGAEIVRTMQEGKPRIDLKVGGVNIFIAPVAPGDGVNPRADDALSGARSFRAAGERHRRGGGRAEGEGGGVHQGADHGAAGRARMLHPCAARRLDRASRPRRVGWIAGGLAAGVTRRRLLGFGWRITLR